MSEYAVTGKDAGKGSLLAALAEAAFLIGLEKNRFLIITKKHQMSYKIKNIFDDFFLCCSDIVEMASYAPLFVNTNDRR